MLACDRSKFKAVDPAAVARLTQRAGPGGGHYGTVAAANLMSYIPRRRSLGLVAPTNTAPTMTSSAMSFASSLVTLNPISFIQSIGNLFGSFSKSPSKVEFDTGRQRIWEQYAKLVDTVDALSAKGQLTSPLLAEYIKALELLMENYYQFYQSIRASAGAEWADPRFQDFYGPMEIKLADWQYLVASGQLPSYVEGAPTGYDEQTGRLTYEQPPLLTAGLSENLPLVLLAGAALFMFSRRGK